MSGTKFYFAEFSISGILPFKEQYDISRDTEDRKRDALIRYLSHREPVVSTATGNWYFGRLEDRGLIYGKFGKTYSDEPIRYDEDIGDFVEVDEKTSDADYSMFVIDFPQRLIAFSSTYRVRNNNFTKNFERGFKNVISDRAEIEVNLITNQENLEEVLEKYPIYKLEAELIPTNPGPEPAFEDLDESMQEMLVEKLGITAERFDGDGINIHEDFLDQVTQMSMSEYGESWRVEYGDDEVLKVISSEEEPATTRLDADIDELGRLMDYSQQLISNAKAYLS